MTTPPLAPRPGAASILPAALVALGLVGAGALVGANIPRLRTADRTVTVKGVAEREARADLAIWPLRLVATDDDLTAANARLAANAQAVRAFLAAQGLGPGANTAVAVQDFTVTDARSNQGSYAPGSRFVIRETVVVRSTDVARVQAAAQRVADLVGAGVVLSSGQEYGAAGPTVPLHQARRAQGADDRRGHRAGAARRRAVRARLAQRARRHPLGLAGLLRDPAARPGAGDLAGEPGGEDRARGDDRGLRPRRLSARAAAGGEPAAAAPSSGAPPREPGEVPLRSSAAAPDSTSSPKPDLARHVEQHVARRLRGRRDHLEPLGAERPHDRVADPGDDVDVAQAPERARARRRGVPRPRASGRRRA
jgi:uncharacterized protein YggE